ncbi:hypothetical protein Taro_031705 [Colocasia esculenta]|uniref:WAT1-related protein n=1 Tax=Colocasia esculenta TaxID=4460 RepID=A0A843W774_COLES|nr:hypothetical protein [Colocasia esculenta]
MNHYVLVVYRNAVAAAVVTPFAFWLERKARPPMTRTCFLKIMALALFEIVLDQNLYYAGVKYTSASFAAALTNMLPAITFVFALILRYMLFLLHPPSKAQRPAIGFPWTKGRAHHAAAAASHEAGAWLKGTFLLMGSCCCWSAFFILQSNTLLSYPAELSLTAWICSMGTVLSAAVTMGMAPGGGPWAIGFDMRLLTAVYSGIMCSGIAYYVQGVVMKERGPVFVAAFNPLCMIIVAFLGSLILAEEITIGRVIGAAIIVVGLYLLMWGKTGDYASEGRAKDVELDFAALKTKPVAEKTSPSPQKSVDVV